MTSIAEAEYDNDSQLVSGRSLSSAGNIEHVVFEVPRQCLVCRDSNDPLGHSIQGGGETQESRSAHAETTQRSRTDDGAAHLQDELALAEAQVDQFRA